LPRITKIPASISRYTSAPIDAPVKRKVAAYARVSTDNEEQLTSYAAQISYYTDYINGREDWEFVKVYTDEGISGCSTKRREGFQAMVADALAGKIDLIITKSVSRFARNTVDSLTTIRSLKEHNVECYFEKENIWTFDGKGELLLTIMSSLSQEEARSISENVTWGQRKRFADGKVSLAYSRFLGYDKGADGKMVINPEQAETVRLIYGLFLEGMTPHTIALTLTERCIKTPSGKDKWNATTVRRILTNEKYKGDALLQKEFTVDFLTKKTKKNCGEIPQYYIEDDHEAIIDPAVFDLVQQEMERRNTGTSRYSGVSIFSSKVKCAECGSWYGAKVWHSTDKYRKVIYRCNHKYGKKRCTTPHITEDEIKVLFLNAVNRLLKRRDELIANVKLICKVVSDTSELETERTKYADEMTLVADMVQAAMVENARVALDQNEYRRRNDELATRFEEAKKKYNELSEQITEREIRGQNLRHFQETLEALKGTITEFDGALWGALVDYITVYEDGSRTVTFRDGTTI
jgi:DNA invertase Pin-like site-specific DNA recombinase